MDKMIKFLKRLYVQIKYRTNCSDFSCHKKYYKGLSIMTKEDMLKYNTNKEFVNLYNNWITSKKNRKLVPTLDRIDSSKGYTVDNVKWKTLSENSKNVRFKLRTPDKQLPVGVRKSRAKHVLKYEARARNNYQYIHLGTYDTVEEAQKAYLDYKSNISVDSAGKVTW